MSNLIAYIPALNRRHVEWFARHPRSTLWLISQKMAETLVPRLVRNIEALPTEMQLEAIYNLKWKLKLEAVCLFDPEQYDPNLPGSWEDWIMADEDISHVVYEKYFQPLGIVSGFEMIWARYDMQAVKASQPVIPDCVLSNEDNDVFRIAQANGIAQKSPDWWRQIGILAFRDNKVLAYGWNEHFPTEYQVGMCGDTRLNFDAGDPAGMDAYLSLHAEEYLLGVCSKKGISLEGASVYINTFPCGRCARALSLTGIKELYFGEGSVFMLKAFEILSGKGVRIIQVRQDPESA